MKLWPWSKSQQLPPMQSVKNALLMMSLSGSKTLANPATSYQQLSAEGYAICWAAYACINKIASATASVEPKLYRKLKGGKLEEIHDHPLLDLLDKPNPTQSRIEFTTYLMTTFMIGGNGYIYGNGMETNPNRPPSEMQILNPGQVRIEPGNSYFPKFYEYKPKAEEAFKYVVDQLSGKSAVMHLKTVNPLHTWYGMSPLLACAYDIDILNSGQKWNKKLLDNDARPSGALIVKNKEGTGPDELTEDQYIRLKKMMDEKFSGGDNAGKPLLLEGGLEWKEFSMSPRDLDFIKGKYASARDVAVSLGVPVQLIGIPGDSTFSNMEQAKVFFWTDTVLPWLSWLLESYNRWLTPLFGNDLFLWYDEEMLPALEPLRKEKANRINNASYMTLNEKRDAMGLDTLPKGAGGDVILVQSSMIPLDLLGEVDPPIEEDEPVDPKKPDDPKRPASTDKPPAKPPRSQGDKV